MHPAAGTDDVILHTFFRASIPAIEELVTRALNNGLRVADIALVLERAFDGNVRATSARRDACARRFGTSPELDAQARQKIVNALETAGPEELPAIFLVQCEGYVAVGIKRLNGEGTSLS
jgi:hypothetical protein